MTDLDALAAEIRAEHRARTNGAPPKPQQTPEQLMTRIRWDVRRLVVETEAREFRGRRIPITATPLLTELRAEIAPSSGGTGSGRSGSASTRAALSIDALDLYETIVDQIGSIYETATDRAAKGTPEQLLTDWLIEWEIAYRAGDLTHAQLTVYADRIGRWVRQIDGHFDPPRSRELPLCPSCGYTHVLVRRDGELVLQRVLVLQVWERSARGRAECRQCGETWSGEVHPGGVTAGIRDLITAVEENFTEYGPLEGPIIHNPEEVSP